MTRRLLWCVGLGLITGVGVLMWFGVRPWTLVFLLLMLVCPAAIIVVVEYARRTFPSASAGDPRQQPRAPRDKGVDGA